MAVRSRIALFLSCALGGLALLAAPASADYLQTADQNAYTGPLTVALDGNAVVTTDLGNITCSSSPVTAALDTPGGTGIPASGEISAFDLKGAGDACNSEIPGATNTDNSVAVPMAINLARLSDNTTGDPNGTFTAFGFSVTAQLSVVSFGNITCTYRGDFADSGGAGNQLRGSFFNPDNTASTDAELRFASAPLDTVSSFPCPATATFNATYKVTGPGGIDLYLREPPTPPVCTDLSVSTPFQTALPIQLSCTGGGALSYAAPIGIFGPPAEPHGTISNLDTAAGTLTYTPDPGFSGTGFFYYSASNGGGGSQFATVTINVAASGGVGGGGNTPSGNPPSTPPGGGTAGQTTKRCKKAKKGASAAKKRCRKKK